MSLWPTWLPTEAVGTILAGVVVYAARRISLAIQKRHLDDDNGDGSTQNANAKTRVELNKTLGMLLARISALEERDEKWREEYTTCRREYLECSMKTIKLERRVARMQEEIDDCHRYHMRPEVE